MTRALLNLQAGEVLSVASRFFSTFKFPLFGPVVKVPEDSPYRSPLASRHFLELSASPYWGKKRPSPQRWGLEEGSELRPHSHPLPPAPGAPNL